MDRNVHKNVQVSLVDGLCFRYLDIFVQIIVQIIVQMAVQLLSF